MKTAITPIVNNRGKRTSRRMATIGPLSADGSSAAIALSTLDDLLMDTLDRLDAGHVSGRLYGHTWIVIPTITGWTYYVDDVTSQCVHMLIGSRETAIRSAISHLAQTAWTAEYDDQTFVDGLPADCRSDLASWIGFQRAYIRERTAGTPDHLIHAAACQRPEPVTYSR